MRNAAGSHLVQYLPGDTVFRVVNEATLTPAQKGGLARIADVMKQYKGTGVQQAINRAVFDLLDMIVVYPVEDENHFCKQKRRSAPRCIPDEKGIDTSRSGISGAY